MKGTKAKDENLISLQSRDSTHAFWTKQAFPLLCPTTSRRDQWVPLFRHYIGSYIISSYLLLLTHVKLYSDERLFIH